MKNIRVSFSSKNLIIDFQTEKFFSTTGEVSFMTFPNDHEGRRLAMNFVEILLSADHNFIIDYCN